jgi:hypothetical protein
LVKASKHQGDVAWLAAEKSMRFKEENGRVAQTTRGCPIQSRILRLSGVTMQPTSPQIPRVSSS